MKTQRTLALTGGADAGPLFVPQLRRAPKLYGTRLPGLYRRRAEKLATPAWIDRKAVAARFVEAQYRTAKTGLLYSVDHIVPLRHPLVCGLHVQGNLRVIPLDENTRKSNLTWPDMPGEQLALLP